MREESEQRGDMCVCVTETAAHLKPTQHCRSTARQQTFKTKLKGKAAAQIVPGLLSVGGNCSRRPAWRTTLWGFRLETPHGGTLGWDRMANTFLSWWGQTSPSLESRSSSEGLRGYFVPHGKELMSGDSLVVTAAEGLPGMLPNVPPGTGQPPMAKESQAPNANSAEAEESCLRDFTAYRS